MQYELVKTRRRTNITKGADLFTEFFKIQDEYDGYIMSASVVRSVFIITFRAPKTKTYTNLKMVPIITDVTFQSDYYLCSSVLYFPEIQKHALVFQAVIGGLTEMYFQQYFLAFFCAYDVDFEAEDNFLGVVMDFSAAQKKWVPRRLQTVHWRKN